jgi:hypothetical protein
MKITNKKMLLILACCCLILPIFTVEQHFSLNCLKVHFTWTYFAKNRRFVPGVKIWLPGAQYLLTTTEKSVQFVEDIFCMRNYKKNHFPFELKKLDFYLSMFVFSKLIFRYFQCFLSSFRSWGFCDFKIN